MLTPIILTNAQMLHAIERGQVNAAQLTDWNTRQRLMGKDDSDEILEALRKLAGTWRKIDNGNAHRRTEPRILGR